MEQDKKEIKYSHSAAEAQEILSRRKFGNNGEELAGWIAMTGNIVKSYRDGYISDQDIANRERFLNYSFNRESMLTTCLGLLEKSSDPKAREQIEPLKRHLSVLRACRSNLLKDTPPRNIAKRIQQKQEERKKEVSGQTQSSEKAKENAKNTPLDPHAAALTGLLIASPFLNNDPKMKGQLAGYAFALISEMDEKTLLQFLKNAKERKNGKETDNTYINMIYDGIEFLQKNGFTNEDILDLRPKKFGRPKDMARVREIFMQHGIINFDATQMYGEETYNFLQHVKNDIRRQDIASANSYDYSVTNPILFDRIEEKSREDLIAHQKELLAQKTAEHEAPKPQVRISSFSIDNYYKKSNLLGR